MTLDAQMQEFNRQRQNQSEQKRKDDQFVIQTDINDLEKERQKRQNIQAKLNEAKLHREKILEEAKLKRLRDSSQTKMIELQQNEKLQQELTYEKNNLRIKRMRELEAARRVIEENEQEKKKRLEQEKIDKENDAKQIEREIQAKIEQEERRVQAIKDRDEKIQRIMSKMQDLVRGNKDKELEQKAERDYIKECL